MLTMHLHIDCDLNKQKWFCIPGAMFKQRWKHEIPSNLSRFLSCIHCHETCNSFLQASVEIAETLQKKRLQRQGAMDFAEAIGNLKQRSSGAGARNRHKISELRIGTEQLFLVLFYPLCLVLPLSFDPRTEVLSWIKSQGHWHTEASFQKHNQRHCRIVLLGDGQLTGDFVLCFAKLCFSESSFFPKSVEAEKCTLFHNLEVVCIYLFSWNHKLRCHVAKQLCRIYAGDGQLMSQTAAGRMGFILHPSFCSNLCLTTDGGNCFFIRCLLHCPGCDRSVLGVSFIL